MRCKLEVFIHIGSPGCGKSVQCKKIAEKYMFGHISKDILIREVESGSERGKLVADMLQSGQSIPDVSFKLK